MGHTRSALPYVRSKLLACFGLLGETHAQQRSMILSYAPSSHAANMNMHISSHFKPYSCCNGYMQSHARQCVVSDLFKMNLRYLNCSERCKITLELQNALASAAAEQGKVVNSAESIKQASFQLE